VNDNLETCYQTFISHVLPNNYNNQKDSQFIIVYVTIPKKDSENLIKKVIDKRLVACVNETPVQSHFIWEGKNSQEPESLLIMKTKKSLFNELNDFVKANHPYKVPEVISINIEQGNSQYLNWINNSTK